MTWKVRIGQGSEIREQNRVMSIRVTEEFAHTDFEIVIKSPTQEDRTQKAGRIDDAIVQISRGSEILVEGYIESVENGDDYVKYMGRSFLLLLGYSTSSKTEASSEDESETLAEYTSKKGEEIITDLIDKFCYHVDGGDDVRDPTLDFSDIDFADVYEGKDIPVHGKKVYQVVRNMCNEFGKDLWSDAGWDGDNDEIVAKYIHVGVKGRGTSEDPHKTLEGGKNLERIPKIRYNTSKTINCLRVIGGGTGKDRVSVFCKDEDSIAENGYIEGEPYTNNMIRSVVTAELVGNKIIEAKKDPVTELEVKPAYYINDLMYGDWVNIIDSYSNIDTVKRIKKITRIFNVDAADSMFIELGEAFSDYALMVRELTKGDVDPEPAMVKLGGSLKLTANDPPDDFVRIDGGDFYDSTGTIQTAGKGICAFWASSTRRLGGDNPGNGNYKKALVEIKDEDLTIWYHVGTEYSGSQLDDAKSENISADSGYTPIGEVILKGKGSNEVYPVYDSENSSYSFIYRDVRPIVGSFNSPQGSYLPLSAGADNSLTGDLWMGGHDIKELKDIWGRPGSWDITIYGGDNGSDNTAALTWDASEQNFNLHSHKITGLAAGTNPSDAVRFDQLSSGGVTAHSDLTELDYASSGHTGFAPSSHTHEWDDITDKPATATRWPTWGEVTGKPTNFEYTSNKNVANGYCGLDSNKNIVLDNAMIIGLNSLQAYADEYNEGIGLYALVEGEYQLQGLLAMDDCTLRCNLAGIDMDGNTIQHAYNINGYHSGVYDWLNINSQSGNFTLMTFLTYNDTLGEIHIRDGVTVMVNGHDIKGAKNIYAYESGTWDNIYFRSPAGDEIIRLLSYNSGGIKVQGVNIYGNLGMLNHNIINVGEISGDSTVSLSLDFSGDDTCKIWKNGNDLMFKDMNNSDGVSLSGLVGGGTGLWEEVSETTIQPKDHDIIQGRSGYDLTIKPASGGILYLG